MPAPQHTEHTHASQRHYMTKSLSLACLLALALLYTTSAHGRTIVLDAVATVDRMAVIAEDAPNMSWAPYTPWANTYYGNAIDFQQGRAMLIRFPLEAVPKGQRVTNAELIFTVTLVSGVEPRLYIWRLLPDWGAGVCHRFRMTRPRQQEWAKPGARGSSQDRAVRPSAVCRIQGPGEYIANVTEDLEIWVTGAAANQGWLISVEDPGMVVRTACPLYESISQWKLRITYESE